MTKRFLRRNTGEYSRLGKRRKKLQKWRRPKGRDNKMRLKQKSYPRTVEIGYKKGKKSRSKIVVVKNIQELEKVGKGVEIVLGRVGQKKKIEIAKFVKEKGLKIKNLDIEKIVALEKKKETKEVSKK